MIKVVAHEAVRCIRVREIGEHMNSNLRAKVPLMPRFLMMIEQVNQVAICFTETKTASNRYYNNLVAIAR